MSIMKRMLFIVFSLTIMFACFPSSGNDPIAENTIRKKKSEFLLSSIVLPNGIKCNISKEYENGLSITTSNLITESDFFQVVKLFNLKSFFGTISFYLPPLINEGEEYGRYFAGYTYIKKNPPRTQVEFLKEQSLLALEPAIKELHELNYIFNEEFYVENLLYVINDYAKLHDQYSKYMDIPSIKEVLEEYKFELISYQKKAFPKMREKYIDDLKKKLFPKDISVVADNRKVYFMCNDFILNKNKEDFHISHWRSLYNLRFKEIVYVVSAYFPRAYSTLDSPSDNEIMEIDLTNK